MELAEALEIVVRRTGVEHYRNLLNPAHPSYNPAYGPIVLRKAQGLPAHAPQPPTAPAPAPPRPGSQRITSANAIASAIQRATLRRDRQLFKIARNCFYRDWSCGCSLGKCHAGRASNGFRDKELWQGDCRRCLDPITPPRWSDRRLVVAAHDEPLGWLAAAECPITVYRKGKSIPPERAHLDVRELPNVGREAHTYLQYIVDEYDRLSPLTLLAQADPFTHSPDYLQRIGLAYAEPTGMSTRYKHDWPPRTVTDHDWVGEHEGLPLRYGDARWFGGDDPAVHRYVTDAWLDRTWNTYFACPRPDSWRYAYGALWAVPRAAIRARPLAFWRSLLERCSHVMTGMDWIRPDAPPVNGWTLEAVWKPLFDPERYPHRSDL